jgi:hypothetical protein
VIWFYERPGQELRITTRFDNTTNEYVLSIEWPDRPPTTERYVNHLAFDRRVTRLQAELTSARWQLTGAPTMTADGWRDPSSRN